MRIGTIMQALQTPILREALPLPLPLPAFPSLPPTHAHTPLLQPDRVRYHTMCIATPIHQPHTKAPFQDKTNNNNNNRRMSPPRAIGIEYCLMKLCPSLPSPPLPLPLPLRSLPYVDGGCPRHRTAIMYRQDRRVDWQLHPNRVCKIN